MVNPCFVSVIADKTQKFWLKDPMWKGTPTVTQLEPQTCPLHCDIPWLRNILPTYLRSLPRLWSAGSDSEIHNSYALEEKWHEKTVSLGWVLLQQNDRSKHALPLAQLASRAAWGQPLGFVNYGFLAWHDVWFQPLLGYGTNQSQVTAEVTIFMAYVWAIWFWKNTARSLNQVKIRKYAIENVILYFNFWVLVSIKDASFDLGLAKCLKVSPHLPLN